MYILSFQLSFSPTPTVQQLQEHEYRSDRAGQLSRSGSVKNTCFGPNRAITNSYNGGDGSHLHRSHNLDYTSLSYVTMAFSFKGHTVVVTGAGGGLGKAYARHLVPGDMADNCCCCLQLLLAICFERSERCRQ